MLSRLLVVAVVGSACASSEAVECEDGRFCPAGSRCAAAGVCLVEPGACGDFGANAPCGDEGGTGFCRGETCEAGVAVSGRITSQGSLAGLPGLAVSAVDRPWMAGDTTDSTGAFELLAVREDRALVVSIAGDADHAPLRTRLLDLGGERYEINGATSAALRTFLRTRLVDMSELLGLEHDPDTGTVAVLIGREVGTPVGNATVELTGDAPAPVLYFAGDGTPDPALTTTSLGSGAAMFVEVVPGRYTLTASHPQAIRCVGAGADQPDPIELEVVAGELSNAGWVICEMAAALPPVRGRTRSRSRSRRAAGRSGTPTAPPPPAAR